jgi:hypothetical protein
MDRKLRKNVWMVAFFALISAAVLSPGSVVAQEPSGTVEIDEYQLAYIFNGNLGGGKLYFNGNV